MLQLHLFLPFLLLTLVIQPDLESDRDSNFGRLNSVLKFNVSPHEVAKLQLFKGKAKKHSPQNWNRKLSQLIAGVAAFTEMFPHQNLMLNNERE